MYVCTTLGPLGVKSIFNLWSPVNSTIKGVC